PDLESAFDATVDEGVVRLERTWPGLLATGTVGGIDVGIGVFALFLVEEGVHQELLAALAFSVGFIALTLANSELFTENFLVPVAAVAARRAQWPKVFRLWGGTAVTKLVGGWVLMAFVIGGLAQVRHTAVQVAEHYP